MAVSRAPRGAAWYVLARLPARPDAATVGSALLAAPLAADRGEAARWALALQALGLALPGADADGVAT